MFFRKFWPSYSMPQVSDDINQSGFTESNNIDKYIRKCEYKVSKFKTKIDNKSVELPGDPESKAFMDVKLGDPGYAKVNSKFIETQLKHDKKLSLSSNFSSTCKIHVKKEANYDREFGYIQTSKIFFKRTYKNEIVYCDFHANVFHGQEEVLDSIGDNNPFYSKTSYYKVPSGTNSSFGIKIKLVDMPNLEIANRDGLENLERYQQFFVYLVMRYKQENANQWTYDVLYSFDWSIYLKWIKATDKNNNIFEYNYGLIENESIRILPKWINSNRFYTCNDDQFYYSINRIDSIININQYPISTYKNKFETICENIENIISNILKLQKLSKNDLKEENSEFVNNKNTKSESNAMKISKLKSLINVLDSIEIEVYKEIESLFSKIKESCVEIKKMDSIKNEFIEYYERMDRSVNKNFEQQNLTLCIENANKMLDEISQYDELWQKLEISNEHVKICASSNYFKNFQNIALEINKLCKFVGIMILEIRTYRENFTSLNLHLNEELTKAAEEISKFDLIIERLKFCVCNSLPEKEICNRIKNALFNINESAESS